MYGVAQHAGARSRMTGMMLSALIVGVVGYGATRQLFHYDTATAPPPMIVTMIEPDTPDVVLPVPEKVEVPVETPPPQLVAPPIEVPPDIPPVIVAPVAPEAPPAPVAPAPVAAPAGSDRVAPKLRTRDEPPYPSASLRANEEGTTHLEVCVSNAGRVTSASVAGSSGHTRLDDSALKWIRDARFTPGSVGGVAQSMCGHDVYYEWRLDRAR
ncbi:MAG TPA: TonB family protein [Hyphomonadaceae bacterium]|nr:TonB family protein [Hyphomonadaceae bacterium]